MKKLLLALAFAATSIPASAQENLPELVDKALLAMNAEKWEEALALNTKAAGFGKNPKMAIQLYGAQFGVILYRKGMCELKLNKFEDAMQSFESCYKDYPNDKVAGGGNIFNKMALLKWGDAAYGLESYELAITQWKKFLEERDKAKDKYAQGSFHVNMAVAHYRLKKIVPGNEHLETAIQNKNIFPTPDEAIVVGFQALVTAAIGASDERVLLDFIAKNRGGLTVAPYAMQRYSKIFMKLAADAMSADMTEACLNLYQFVPSSEVAIDDLRARIRDMGHLPRLSSGTLRLDKANLESQLSALEAEFRGNKAIEMIKLAAIAFIHESNGNVHGSHAAYLQLENYFPRAEKREDNLFHLVRTSSVVGKVMDSRKYGERFLVAFPESKYKPDVQKLMLSSLFFSGKYEICIEVAGDIIENGKAAEGTPEHDLSLFVLGGSYFYTGQYDKAAPFLDQHVEKYPESMFAMSASYFQASNVSRLQFWSKAAKLLDTFLEKYKDDPNKSYIPLALYDRANTHFAEEEMEPARDKTDRIIKEFPDSPITDQAYNLRGNVLQTLKELEEAEKSYLKALEIAEIRSNDGVAGEALYYLVSMLGEHKKGDDYGPRLKDAVPFADKFWEQYAMDSPYRPQVSVAQMYAMESVGRGQEALERLQEVISDMAKLPEAVGLEEAINSYTEFYLEKHSADELKEHYYNFPGIRTTDKAARALLRIAIIGVFEQIAQDKENPDKQRSAEAMIIVLFQNLKADFNLKDLSNYILVKLGDYLRTNTAAPREALPFYDEALSRQNQAYRFQALIGRADVYGQSPQDADLERALADFERIFSDSQEKKDREFALFRIVEILMKKGEYSKAAERANHYLDREEGKSLGFTTYSPQVGFMLAQSFDKRNMSDDAISMYVKVWSAHMGFIKVSAPAVEAWMTLSHKRNRTSDKPGVPSDRQGAYEGGYRYLELTGRFKDKMTPEEVKLWERVQKLTDQYVADPNVKSMEQVLKEKEEASKRR
jgi:tetratricopeptide (TPR) repeat protein